MMYKLSFQYHSPETGRTPIYVVVGGIDATYRLFHSLKRDEALTFKVAAEIRPLLPGGDAGEKSYSYGDLISEDRVPPC
jgi:hypothetical protein